MKMRKSTWLLLVLALAAILLVAGCEPTTPAPTPPENGEEPPPTTPPADKECPKVVKTVVNNLYESDPGWFKITITFDEDIYSACAENPDNWTIKVKNSGRQNKEIGAFVGESIIVGNKIIMYAYVGEPVDYKVKYENVEGDKAIFAPQDVPFLGLICSEDDADRYATNYEGATYGGEEWDELWDVISSNVAAPTAADLVTWGLKEGCAIFDVLGNTCCEYSGSACCIEPYCEECDEGCLFTGGVCY